MRQILAPSFLDGNLTQMYIVILHNKNCSSDACFAPNTSNLNQTYIRDSKEIKKG